MLGPIEMGDHAAFEALGAVMAEAQHLKLHAFAGNFEPVWSRPGPGDQAADLARAHVKRGYDLLPLATIETCLLHPPDSHSGISLGACRRHVRSGTAALGHHRLGLVADAYAYPVGETKVDRGNVAGEQTAVPI